MVSVSLVDDHELVRAGIRRILEDLKGFKVVGEAHCSEDAVKWCRNNCVNIVLMDMNMLGIGGLEAAKLCAFAGYQSYHADHLRRNLSPAKVMQAIAAGYLSKAAAPRKAICDICAVNANKRYRVRYHSADVPESA
ncbi:MAG: Response regulator UvrY [Sodalis sp.]|nr:MAG: Response regulator UvrY [Sodalis sp.]